MIQCVPSAYNEQMHDSVQYVRTAYKILGLRNYHSS